MWKPEYAANRRKRAAEDDAYRSKRAAQGKSKDAEQRRAYMRDWVARNADRVREYRQATADERNARRRERYASDAALRDKTRKEARAWQQANPSKRLAQRVRKYGLTAEQYKQRLADQGGGCAICAATSSRGKPGERLHVDHCHQSGRVRGLLCSECNRGIGHFRDDAERLERAAAYLRMQSR